MTVIHSHRRAAVLACAIALVLQVSPAMAGDQRDSANNSRPVRITFTKWIAGYPLMKGDTGGDIAGVFVGEVLQLQDSTNPDLNPIRRLEAIYEVQGGDRSFTALIRGGANRVTGAAVLDGVVLAGWRTGAPVHVEFDTIDGCFGAPAGDPCFVGTIDVGRAPVAKN